MVLLGGYPLRACIIEVNLLRVVTRVAVSQDFNSTLFYSSDDNFPGLSVL